VASIAVATLRLYEAETLLTQDLVNQAAVLLSFATEEFGKAVLLLGAWGRGGDIELIEGFYVHQDKLNAAAEFIGGPGLLERARLDRLYVDWGGRWLWNEEALNPADIAGGITALDGAIARFWLEWPGESAT
jgi:hypothetical protein